MKRAPLAGGPSIPLQEDDLPAIAGGTPVRTRDARLVFGAPVIGEAEVASVVECLRSRWIGLGPRVEELEQEFRSLQGCALCSRRKQRNGRNPSRSGRAGHWSGR